MPLNLRRAGRQAHGDAALDAAADIPVNADMHAAGMGVAPEALDPVVFEQPAAAAGLEQAVDGADREALRESDIAPIASALVQGQGVARPSLYLDYMSPDFSPRFFSQFGEHVPGFFGKVKTGAMKKQRAREDREEGGGDGVSGIQDAMKGGAFEGLPIL